MSKKMTATLSEKRKALKAEAADLVAKADGEERDLTDAESTRIDEIVEEVRDLDGKIVKFAALEEDDDVEAETEVRAVPRVEVKREESTYRKEGRSSYFRDLVAAQLPQAGLSGADEARERLARHAKEVRDINTTDGNGGHFVPPRHLVDQFIPLARGSRPVADSITNLPLPPGTDSINIPKVATGTGVAAQTTQNTGVTEVDLTDVNVNAPVRTAAGIQDISLQLLDQSPVAFDEIIFQDLVAAHAEFIEGQVIAGTGANGQALGMTALTSNTVSVAYTTTGPTVAGVYPKILSAVSQIQTGRKASPTVIVMAPRRWAWFQSAVDSNGRPLVVPRENVPSNAISVLGEQAVEQVVGGLAGIPVLTSFQVPLNFNNEQTTAADEQDVIIVTRASDHYLYESAPQTGVFTDVGSGTLTVRLRLHNYFAYTAQRYNSNTAFVQGTGLKVPTF